MGYVAVGFLGVLLGAAATGAVALFLLQRTADRDLVERRLRALVAYREALGAPPGLLQGGNGALDPAEAEQLVHNLEAALREFRLTSWLFQDGVRLRLARSFAAIEDEAHRVRDGGSRGSPVRLIDAYRQLELTLRHAAAGGVREFTRWRAWPPRKPADGVLPNAEEAWSDPPAVELPPPRRTLSS